MKTEQKTIVGSIEHVDAEASKLRSEGWESAAPPMWRGHGIEWHQTFTRAMRGQPQEQFGPKAASVTAALRERFKNEPFTTFKAYSFLINQTKPGDHVPSEDEVYDLLQALNRSGEAELIPVDGEFAWRMSPRFGVP